MRNHLEPVDIAMVKAIEDGEQTQITQFLNLIDVDRMLDIVARTHTLKTALQVHKEYEKMKGGEKET